MITLLANWIYLGWLLMHVCQALAFGWVATKLRNPWAYVVFGSCTVLALMSLIGCLFVLNSDLNLFPIGLSDFAREVTVGKAGYYVRSLAMFGFSIGFLLFAFSLRNLRQSQPNTD